MEVEPHKRRLEDAFEHHEGPLNLRGNQFLPTPSTSTVSSMSDARASPAPSDSDLSSIQDVSSMGSPTKRAITAVTSGPPAKRRKLTPGEKAAKAAEKARLEAEKAQQKAEKDAQKASEKERKDAEKLERDEQKRAKAEQREKEQAIKAAERAKKQELKLQKEEEKAAKEAREQAEKLKKERSQLRLGAFLKAPVAATSGMFTPTKFPARSRSLSVETYDDSIIRHAASPSHPEEQAVQRTPQLSEYRRFFLPFQVRPHMSLCTPACHDETAQASFDQDVESVSGEAFDLGLQQSALPLGKMLGGASRRIRSIISVKQIHEKAQTTGLDPTTHLAAVLAKHPVRYIHFCEDVRPAYVGTYSSINSERLARKARLYPTSRFRSDTNYDYDSEAEWDDAEEGEEIGNEEDDEESIGDADGMDEFLDDENDELAMRRKTALSDLEVQSTGICWQDSKGKQDGTDENRRLLSSLRIQMLLPQSTIDPFSSSYWQTTKASVAPVESETRPILAERSTNTPSKIPESAWPIKDKEGGKRGPKPGAQKTMTSEELEEFKAVVIGSAKSKQDMIAELKEAFPKLTAALVKDTLSEQFAYMGKTKADKKWKHVGTV